MQPNFLVFVTDQQRADHLGCYGNTIVCTPQIDSLAQAGTRFERAYVANPVCMPNRGSIMTGRMPTSHGTRSNGIPLPLESVTFADVLAEFGYRTALIGKSHLQNMEDKPPVLPPRTVEPGIRESQAYPEAVRDVTLPARYLQEARSRWADPTHQLELPYYGFQDVVLCNNHADECFGDYLRWLQQSHPQVADRIGREHGERDPAFVAPQAWKTRLNENQYPTHYIADQTCNWIRRHTQSHADRPFALVCSFPDPHHPWTPPGKYWDMYRPQDMPLPATATNVHGRQRHAQWLADERSSGRANLEGPRIFGATPREIQEILALTFGMITNIDDRIGLVLQTLKDCGADDNTVVIFTSDHGDLMGDHGAMLKGPLHYQGLIRVPFIWRDLPGAGDAAPKVRSDLVSSIDLAASILRRADIASPNGVQGRALVGPQGEARESGRSAVLVEENQQRAFMSFDTPVRVRTIVTQTHRMSVFQEGDWGELYDLQADPHEVHNLWDDAQAAGLRSSMLEQLLRLLIEHSETSPRPTRLA